MSTRPLRIAEGDLLEHSQDEDIIDGAEWNAVMGNLKKVVNNHAEILGAQDPQSGGLKYFSKLIKQEDWELENNSDPHGYVTYISKANHGLEGYLNIVMYNTSGTPVIGGWVVSPESNDITIRSRISDTFIIIIQGIGNKAQ